MWADIPGLDGWVKPQCAGTTLRCLLTHVGCVALTPILKMFSGVGGVLGFLPQGAVCGF